MKDRAGRGFFSLMLSVKSLLRPVVFGVAAIVFAQSHNGIAGYLRRPDFAELARRSAWRTDRRRATERLAGAALASDGTA